MKKLRYITTCLIFLAAMSCNNSTESNQNKTEEAGQVDSAYEKLDGFEVKDLSEFDIDAMIQLPNEGSPISINASPTGDVVINDGKHFNFTITPFGFSLEELRAELDNDLVYEVTYLEENAEYIIFEKSIPESDVDKEVHFIMVKEHNGDLYEIKSSAENSFKKHHIDKMIKSASSLSFKSNA